MISYQPRFYEELKSQLKAVRERHIELLEKGWCQSYDAYRYEVGYLKALDEIGELSDNIRKKIMES